MRVAIFFDGKNFYSSYKESANSHVVDFIKLSNWLVKKAGGTILTGAHYYTGVESDPTAASTEKLTQFLDKLEVQPGYFVYRFPRKKRTSTCQACGDIATYTTEKEVDTTMVADMLRLAAVNAFDILILLSGDSDHAPALEGVRLLGKIAYVSTWGGTGLSGRLRRAAFDHIDLKLGLDAFSQNTTSLYKAPQKQAERDPSADDGAEAFLCELEKAEAHFSPKYIGISYFISKWRSDVLVKEPIIRKRILNRLHELGKIELYTTQDGAKAMRIKKSK